MTALGANPMSVFYRYWPENPPYFFFPQPWLPSLVRLPHLARPRVKHGMTRNLVITRRYLYADRLFVAWVHRDVTQRADIFRVRR